jgi:hypothetical protein
VLGDHQREILMGKRDRVATWLCTALAGVLGAGGCFAIADLNRFHTAGGSADAGSDVEAGMEAGVDDPTLPSALSLTLHDFGFHFQQLIEFRLIDDQNRIQCRGIIRPLDQAGTVQISVNVPKAILTMNTPYRLDFYADVNASGGYDGIGNVLTQDHAWRVAPLADFPTGELTHISNVVQVFFEHNTDFTDIDSWPMVGQHNPPQDTGLAARVHFDAASLSAWRGKLVQLRIAEAATGHVVGIYRDPQIPNEDFVADIQGVLDPGVDYYLEIYVDANGDGVYQNPAQPSPNADLGWRIAMKATTGSSDAGVQDAAPPTSNDETYQEPYGIDYTFNALKDPNPNNVDVGPP